MSIPGYNFSGIPLSPVINAPSGTSGWLATPAGVYAPGAFDGWSLNDAPVNGYDPKLDNFDSFEDPFSSLPGAQNSGGSQLGTARVSSNETTGEDQSNLSTVFKVNAAPFVEEVLPLYTKNSPVFLSIYNRPTNRPKTEQVFDVPFLNSCLAARSLRNREQAIVRAANRTVGIVEEDVSASMNADTLEELVSKFAFAGSIAAVSPTKSSQSGMSAQLVKRQRPMETLNGERYISIFDSGRCEIYQWFSPDDLRIGSMLYMSAGCYDYPYTVQIDSNGVSFGSNTGSNRSILSVRAFADSDRLGVSQVSNVSTSRLLTNNEAFLPIESDIAFTRRHDTIVSTWAEYEYDEATGRWSDRQENVGRDAEAIPQIIYNRVENGHLWKVGKIVGNGKGSGSTVMTSEAAFKRSTMNSMPMAVLHLKTKCLTRVQ
jgi:hypothetical protein